MVQNLALCNAQLQILTFNFLLTFLAMFIVASNSLQSSPLPETEHQGKDSNIHDPGQCLLCLVLKINFLTAFSTLRSAGLA